jgi:hypothetical protein
LEYLAELLRRSDVRETGNAFWTVASPASASTNLAWLLFLFRLSLSLPFRAQAVCAQMLVDAQADRFHASYRERLPVTHA